MKTRKSSVIDYDNLQLIDISSDHEQLDGEIDDWKDELILLDMDTLISMSSGTCIIPPNQENPIAVCKDGSIIKIFKIRERQLTHLNPATENLVAITGEG